MKAALQVTWTLFTAVPLQRVLAVLGCVLFGFAVLGSLWQDVWLVLGIIAFIVLTAGPALFVAPALFRSLSGERTLQLLPHFRLRMLIGTSLLLCALLAVAATLMFGVSMAAERTVQISALGLPLAFLVGMFLLLFLAFGDWRWGILLPLSLVTLANLRRLSPEAVDFLRALPVWVWWAAGLVAWAGFSAWYLRVRRVRPIMLMPPPRAAKLDAGRPVTRAVAIRTMLAANALEWFVYGFRTTPSYSFVALVGFGLIVLGVRFFSLTSLIWPLGFMLIFGERSVAIVRQSRLLWLKIPGSRDLVRRQIERVLWRNLGIGCGFLVIIAAIAVSPFVGASPSQVLLGFAVTACAAIYGTYVAIAAVPSVATTYILGCGVMILLQVLLLARPAPPEIVAVMIGAELAGAALVRTFAVSRWRRLDWLRLRPLATLAGVPRAFG